MASEVTTESAIAYYDTLWAATTHVDQHHKCRAYAIEKVLKQLPPGANGRRKILELGCGTGIISSLLARYGDVVGLDQSRVGVETARAHVPGRFEVAVLPSIPIADRDFDLVVLSQVIEHFVPDQQAEMLRAARERTATSGHILITTPNKDVSRRMQFENGELQPIETWLTPDELCALLERTGWTVERTSFAFSFLPILASKSKVARAARYAAYDVLRMRSVIESLLEDRAVGDTTVVVARRR